GRRPSRGAGPPPRASSRCGRPGRRTRSCRDAGRPPRPHARSSACRRVREGVVPTGREGQRGSMADKPGARSALQDLEASGPDGIRNVVLVGPSSAGKTTLLETLLATAGAIPRAGSVTDGTTVSDHDEAE